MYQEVHCIVKEVNLVGVERSATIHDIGQTIHLVGVERGATNR